MAEEFIRLDEPRHAKEVSREVGQLGFFHCEEVIATNKARLANHWLEIAWRLWQDRVPYDEERHLRQHALRVRPN